LAACGLQRLLERRRARTASAGTLTLALLALWAAESIPRPIALEEVRLGADLPPVHAWLAAQPHGAFSIFELPTDGAFLKDNLQPLHLANQFMYSMAHGHPLPLVVVNYACRDDAALQDMAPWDRAARTGLVDPQLVADHAIRYLIVHL